MSSFVGECSELLGFLVYISAVDDVSFALGVFYAWCFGSDEPGSPSTLLLTKAFRSRLLDVVQLTHRIDLDLGEAMQNTERYERVELDVNQETLTLPPDSITRLKLTIP